MRTIKINEQWNSAVASQPSPMGHITNGYQASLGIHIPAGRRQMKFLVAGS